MILSEEYKKKIFKICNTHNIKELYVFGSMLRNDFGENSYIDLAVTFDRNGIQGSFDQYFNFKQDMENLFKRRVDVICLTSIKNTVFKQEINKTKELIYAA